MPFEKIKKIQALAAQGVGGEKANAIRILERVVGRVIEFPTSAAEPGIISAAYSYAGLDDYEREARMFRVLYYKPEHQPVLNEVLAREILTTGLKIYEAEDTAGFAYYLSGVNVCFEDMPLCYAALHQQDYLAVHPGGLTAEYWKLPGTNLGQIKPGGFYAGGEIAARLKCLTASDLRARGFDIPADFEYQEGEDSGIRNATKHQLSQAH